MMKDIQISTIVPLYKGKKYISNIIRNIEKCAVSANIFIEVIFINDYPQENITICDVYNQDYLKVCILDNECNIGIHGTRLRGVKFAQGTLIHFLDQDDYIDDNFYSSQISAIENCDAVISLAYEGKEKHYEECNTLDDYISIESLIKNGNAIISPGQVLIRKSSIPEKWKKDVLKYNGADDYFLWMCMVHEGKKMRFNKNTFFHHVLVSGVNATENWGEMRRSVQEAFWKCQCDYFTEYEKLLCYERQISDIEKIERKNKISEIIAKWMLLVKKGIDISSYFLSQNVNEVSIYGLGLLGKYLYYEIKDSIRVEYLFDQKVQKIDAIEVINYKKHPVRNKVIVLTIVGEEKDVEEYLKENNNQVVKLNDVILELYNTVI